MSLRGTIIAALVVIELAIVGESVAALHGGQPAPWSAQLTGARAESGPQFVKDGPHQRFAAGPHPALTVDIGYADLTILTRETSQIEVGVRASTAFGILREKAPIAARADGETIRIETSDKHAWSTGDDRMVTVLVPPGTKVTVVNAGNIRANGLRAEASFNSTGNGSVTVEDYDAPALHVASSSGRISLHRFVAARLDATSSKGRVEGTGLQVRDGSVDADGRVALGFAAGADTLVTAEASNGRVSALGFAAASEDVSSSRSVRVGTGHGHFDVHSSDGNITLSQET